jgi:hypothetical protein
MSSWDSTSTLTSSEESDDVSGPNMLSLPGDKTPEEARLEREGCFRSLQVFRYNLYQKEINSKSDYALFDLLYYEDELRKNCQTEIVLRQKEKGDMNSNTHSPSFEDEMSRLCQDNWLQTRDWWWTRGWMMGTSGPLGRAFELWRSNHSWYMHPVLVEDCKARGGCCGRDCGCCLDYQRANSSAGVLGAGHCTVKCGCCLESRGSETNSVGKRYYAARFTFDNKFGIINFQEDPYRRRVCLAAIWGLSLNDI